MAKKHIITGFKGIGAHMGAGYIFTTIKTQTGFARWCMEHYNTAKLLNISFIKLRSLIHVCKFVILLLFFKIF
jgi:hypothetical protein